jgi:hypothetical protein
LDVFLKSGHARGYEALGICSSVVFCSAVRRPAARKMGASAGDSAAHNAMLSGALQRVRSN